MEDQLNSEVYVVLGRHLAQIYAEVSRYLVSNGEAEAPELVAVRLLRFLPETEVPDAEYTATFGAYGRRLPSPDDLSDEEGDEEEFAEMDKVQRGLLLLLDTYMESIRADGAQLAPNYRYTAGWRSILDL